MFKVVVEYPDELEEERILTLHSQQVDLNQRLETEIATVTSPEEIMQQLTTNAQIRIEPALVQYINRLVRQTRNWPAFYLGASPRAGLALMQGARTLAAFRGRDFAIPDDVVDIALPALRHRVILTAEAEVEGLRVDDQLRLLLRSIEVPRGA
ncbi:MAG: MoxR family ATPase, partial [Planctomycetales bacterium]|nr:MoxR family ATPase [Planctomycetales bacterium]